MCFSWAKHVSHLFQLGETCVSAGRDMCLTFFSLVRHVSQLCDTVSHLFQFLAQTLPLAGYPASLGRKGVRKGGEGGREGREGAGGEGGDGKEGGRGRRGGREGRGGRGEREGGDGR